MGGDIGEEREGREQGGGGGAESWVNVAGVNAERFN